MYLELHLPLPDEQVFRYQAMGEIVQLVSENPTREFGNRELRTLTGYAGPSVTKSLDLLQQLSVLTSRTEGNRTLYSINSDILHESADPLLTIQQKEFRQPIKALIENSLNELDSIVGIIVFGSVARGEADRASDIDCLVLVENEVVKARRRLQDVITTLQQQRFDGERYVFETLVESVQTASNRGAELRPIFQEGIVVQETETLDRVRDTVFSPEAAQ
jgi:predicted nucleotidyltransferase